MNLPQEEEKFAERRQRLVGDIARQRGEFSLAYNKLEQPLRYTEYGLRGVGFLRANPWVFAAVPAVVSVIKIIWSKPSAKKKSPPLPPSRQVQGEAPQLSGFRKTAATWAGYGWQLFQLYRQVRSYLP